MNKDYKSVELNKVNYSIRSSQALYQYGVGGLVDFRDQTLMTASPESWEVREMVNIDDERLARSLRVDMFKMPGGKENSTMSYVRFPEWYFCPRCHRFMPISEWVKEYKVNASPTTIEYDPYMVKHMKCPKCRKQDLVVTRLVTVCDNGHISDFPWVEWVHARNFNGAKDICSNPKLKFTTGGGSGGLGGMFVDCSCGAKANLRDSFDPKTFEELDNKYPGRYNFKCKGNHPWKRVFGENCGCYPRAMQRGGSSVYYPYTVKSLLIPPYSDELNRKVVNTENYMSLISIIKDIKENEDDADIINKFIDQRTNKYAVKIAEEIGSGDIVKIASILKRKFMTNEDDFITADSLRYKEEEYLALSGKAEKQSGDNSDFKREGTNIDDYNIPFLKQVSLITKVKEVRAQTGFTRIKPTEKSEDGSNSSQIVDIKGKGYNWYPAYQVFGEGIFVEFDQDKINEWINRNPDVMKRADLLNSNYKKSFGSDSKRTITPRFLLLHTISHLLIKQLSFECGYNIASLSERLYCSETIGNMAGIFIYTSDGDSEGTLGGLVRQGRKDTFPNVFRKAIESAINCSNDPVCSLSNGQGRDSLNLAACYSCTLIPETSCEEFNELLDRGVVVGTFDNKEIAFYKDYLYEGKEWINTFTKEQKTQNNKEEKNTEIIKKLKVYDGTDYSIPYEEIWKNILSWTENNDEKTVLNALINDDRYNQLEKPISGCSFLIIGEEQNEYTCDLVWKNAKVMLFSQDNNKDYNIAKGSDYKCFTLTSDDLCEQLLIALKGE